MHSTAWDSFNTKVTPQCHPRLMGGGRAAKIKQAQLYSRDIYNNKRDY